MSEQAELNLQDYLQILKRRWLFLLIPFVLITAMSAVVAVVMPPVYESSGTILVESQQIPDEFIRSTVTSYADERIQIIQQLVMTRENLLRIAEEFNLFDNVRERLTTSAQVDFIRSGVKVRKLATSNSPNSRNTATLAFSVGFEHESPEVAHAVANELMTLFLDENVRSRTERASETTDFLAFEADKLRQQLVQLESRIATFKQENSNALPEHLNMYVGMLDRTEVAIREADLSIERAMDELTFLEIELAATESGETSSGQVAMTPEAELNQARSELTRLKARYSDIHPDVVRTIRRIEQLEDEVESNAGSQSGSANSLAMSGNIDSTRIRARISTTQERINSLNEQLIDLRERKTELDDIIALTPQVERSLVSLERDHERLLKKYEEMQSEEMEARLAESLEQGKKAERFSPLELPNRPDEPIKPNRKKIFVMGVFFAVAASVGLTGLFELSDNRIRSAEALTVLLHERPLVSIPYIKTVEENVQKRRVLFWLLTGGTGLAVLMIIAIHFLYMPLDLLFYKVVDRIS